jgi:hypothetical protein
VLSHILVVDPDVFQRQARQLGQVAVVLGIEPRPYDVDDLDRTRFLGPRLEQLFLAGANRPVLQLLLDDLQPFVDLVVVDARAVAAEQELDDIGRHRVLARVLAHEVLANEVAVERCCAQPVDVVHFDAHFASPIVVARESMTRPVPSRTTTIAAVPSYSSRSTARLA